MIKNLWLWFFPLLFLPNLAGFTQATPFGTLEISDFLIGPYLILLFLARLGNTRTQLQKKKNQAVDFLLPLLMLFAGVAIVSTLTIGLRYEYADTRHFIRFGLLKLGKLGLYVVAAILTIRVIKHNDLRLKFDWALLGSGLVVGIGLFIGERYSQSTIITQEDVGAYKAGNAISVMVAMLLCYLVSRYFCDTTPTRWRKFAPLVFVVLGVGFFLSHGRGGWIVALCGLCYLLYKRATLRVFVGVIVAGGILSGLAYRYLPEFREEVKMTVRIGENSPNILIGEQLVLGGRVSEGGRTGIWRKHVNLFFSKEFWPSGAFFIGAGFFHRDGNVSGLAPTGSHSFWLQMFLETGLIGGSLALLVIWRIWRQAKFFERLRSPFAVPVQAALLAGVLGAMSGEYFYGSVVPFMLFVIYGQIGSYTAEDVHQFKNMNTVPKADVGNSLL